MGNLCSSGAERSEKKEENQLPDKPRDGEDEVLLPKGEAAVELNADGVQVSSSGGDGVGLGEALGAALSQGKADVSASIETEAHQFSSEGQSAFTRVVQSGKENVETRIQQVNLSADSTASSVATRGKNVIEDVQSAVEETVTSAKAATQDAAAEAVNTVQEKIENIALQTSQQASSVSENVSSTISTLTSAAVSGAQSAKEETQNVSQSIEAAGAETSNQVLSNGNDTVSALDEVNKDIESNAQSNFETLQCSGTSLVNDANDTLDAGAEQVYTFQSEAEKSLQDDILDKFEELKSSTLNTVESFQKSADETFTKTVDNAQQSASATAGDLISQAEQSTEAKSQQAFDASENVNNEVIESAQYVSDSVVNVEADIQESASNTLSAAVDAAKDASTEAQGFVSDSCQLLNETSQSASETVAQAENVLAEDQQLLKDEASQAVTNAVDATVSTAEDVEREAASAISVVSENATDFTEASTAVQEKEETITQTCTESNTTSSGILDNLSATVQNVLQSGANIVQENIVEKLIGNRDEAAYDESLDINPADVEVRKEDSINEPTFLEKAKSLLEAHRNSLDETKTVSLINETENISGKDEMEEAVRDVVEGVVKEVESSASAQKSDDVESVEPTQQPENVDEQESSEATEAAQEATARDFVESIIEKATSLVAESFNKQDEESEEEVSTSSEVSVERGEETMEPKKRGVMFVSPQLSEQSSLQLSSPPELSPPAVDDLTPPSDSTNSSGSQNESVDKDELFSSPVSAPTIIFNENNNNNNVLNNNTEEEDESFQRVAMEVTTKAVQDAIKIVTENGTGTFLANPALSNDIGVSSPSSPENDEEEMTTTDSSQVERGSPVSDITDTSAQGSVSESLSSYDPGAVFRQDVANLADLVTSPIDNISPAESTSADFPAAPLNAATYNDLINFEESSSSQANTPTNAAVNNTCHLPLDDNEDQISNDADPLLPLPSEVPSSLSFDDFNSSPGKPTIVINSPDSAHHTNGSAEDLTTSQSEALI
ncbi:dentin sialophosphoprotein [Biomphalaria pfeifferi]|uniref:Dentin sialophosphoprotein n=1 Tax=Biomphalaria pfeifferi TaxID=112525 RepID=A0AAD8AXL4_BIOPF|nr:dentin sialophosphoprotein [Biomphalaria pfeifferi]